MPETSSHPESPHTVFSKEDVEQSIPARFEEMAAQYPDRLAVQGASGSLTFRELNREANRMAQAILDRLGERPEPVALLLDHDTPLVVSMLGALKAGKFYVTLDPTYPSAYIQHIIEDLGASMIVTNDQNLALTCEWVHTIPHVINFDALPDAFPKGNMELPLSAEGPAFILYTSGSTGRPKGVLHPHRSLLFEIASDTNEFHISREDRFALCHSCSFALSKRSLYSPLLNGGSLFLHDIKKRGLVRLAELMAKESITMLRSMPSTFRHLVESVPAGLSFPHLRFIILGGEPLTRNDVELYKGAFPPSCSLVNVIGPTEAFTIRRNFLNHQSVMEVDPVPIGYPVEGKEILLLDESGQPVEPGEVGEMVIKSAYLATGYWKRPDLTEAAFPSHPGGGEERIYRTGDIGRMDADGCLHHLGRKDFQVKIKGYRIETSQIEAALQEMEVVQDAAVRAHPDATGQQRLVAYVILTSKGSPTASELRQALSQSLPEYMVPSSFVIMDTFPRTPSGKVNFRELPKPGTERPHLDTPYIAPTTPMEIELAQIWCEVLCLDEVGVNDSFLELGGDSLRATQLISRVFEKFQVEVSIQDLMKAPTIAGMIEEILQMEVDQIGPDEMKRLLDIVETSSENDAAHPV